VTKKRLILDKNPIAKENSDAKQNGRILFISLWEKEKKGSKLERGGNVN